MNIENHYRIVEAARNLAREARAAAYVFRSMAGREENLEKRQNYEAAARELEQASEALQMELRQDKSND